MPNSNSQWCHSPEAHIPTSKLGRDREEPAALPRIRTWPECPEGNLRELTWGSNLNCGIAREREIIIP